MRIIDINYIPINTLMLLDCFTFFRELDLLEGRLEYLYDVVDYFVIVEADITHSCNKKDLNFLKNINRYKPYLDKILYQPISINIHQFKDIVSSDVLSYDSISWKIENYQRSHIDNVLKLFDDNTQVMISDLDEIPLKNSIKELDLLNTYSCFSLIQKLYYYNFNQYSSIPWNGTVVARNSMAKEQGAQWLRNMRNDIPKVFDSGYHLSYWGTPEDIKIKLENFAHQENNKSEYTNLENIEYHIKNNLDPFDRVPMVKSSSKEIDPEFFKIFSKYTKLRSYGNE